jgi:hypothetical protein
VWLVPEKIKTLFYSCLQLIFFSLVQQPNASQGLLIEVSRSHSDTPQSVGILWMRDRPGLSQRPLPENTQHSPDTNIHASLRFEPAIPASERLQILALDRSTTGMDFTANLRDKKLIRFALLKYMCIWLTQPSSGCCRHCLYGKYCKYCNASEIGLMPVKVCKT